jgi:CRP-like cAMP-binding protein
VKSFFLQRDQESKVDLLAEASSLVRTYQRGALIYQQGERRDEFFQLVTGRVRIYIAMANGSERVLSYAEPGSTFGESACFDEKPYYTTSVAVRTSQVRVFKRNAVLRFASDRPEVLHHIFRALARKQRILAMHLSAEGLSARERAVVLLNDLIDAYGDDVDDGRHVRLHTGLSIEELASLVGVTRVTMSRELSELARRGVVAKEGLDIIVLDPLELRRELLTLRI